MNRTEIATLIAARLAASRDYLSRDMAAPGRVESAFVDGLLLDAVAREIHDRFPPTDKMVLKR
jgi:hypothetical protein